MATVPALSSSNLVSVKPLTRKFVCKNISFRAGSLPLRRQRRNHQVAPFSVSPRSGGGYETVDEPFFDGYDMLAEDDEISDDEADETESSLDLLIRFLQSMFNKVSRRAKRATRSILPSAISPQLVSFAVDGILLLASLSIVKAFLEVICNLGGTVFAVILLLRIVWASVSYFQSNGNSFNPNGSSVGSPQPMA